MLKVLCALLLVVSGRAIVVLYETVVGSGGVNVEYLYTSGAAPIIIWCKTPTTVD